MNLSFQNSDFISLENINLNINNYSIELLFIENSKLTQFPFQILNVEAIDIRNCIFLESDNYLLKGNFLIIFNF